MTSTPPPSGMCTSSSTTSGRRPAIAVSASSTLAASPAISSRVSSSARAQDRKSSWSSTIRTRGALISLPPVAPALPRCPRRCALDRRQAAVARHSRRSTHARRGGRGNVGQLEARPRSRMNTCGARRRTLRRRPPAAAAELRCVGHGLPRCGCMPPRSRPDRHPRPRRPRWGRRGAPDLGRGGLERRRRPGPPPAMADPRARRAAPAPGGARQGGDLLGLGGAALHQRERLEHRSWKWAAISAFLRRMRCARSLASERTDAHPRSEYHTEHHVTAITYSSRRGRLRGARRLQEGDTGGDDERDADAGARDGRRGPSGVGMP